MKIKLPLLLCFGAAFLVLFLGCNRKSKLVELSQEEENWLHQHRGSVIVATEKNFPPFSFIDHQGFFRGISADYLSEIEQILQISFVYAPPFHLAKNLELLKNKEVDMISSLSKTKERSSYLCFSESYCQIPTVIITSDTIRESLKPEDMEGMLIGVGQDYGVHEYLMDQYPKLSLFPQRDDLICLQKLAIGELDAVVTDLSSASYFIRENNMLHLKVSGSVDYTYQLCMAVSKDQPLLASSVNKAISAIGQDKKDEIMKKWGALQIPFSKYHHIAIICITVLLLLIVVWLMGLNIRRNRRSSASL
jgi:ABC-type amino acid transport substrate-binding protein